MSDFHLIFESIKSRLLNSSLTIFLTAFGVSIALLITQFSNHVQERLNKDGENVDIVVGAKGSPLQLILSSLYHIDIPTGNIPYNEAKKIMNHPQIKTAIPLALGDNWKGHRIVGTTSEYLKHYDAKLKEGRTWNKNFEVVVGSSVKLIVNNEFIGAHGLFDEGDFHQNNKYIVTGILNPTGTVLDRLIITSFESVIEIHNQNEGEHDHKEQKSMTKYNEEHTKHTEHGEHGEHGEHKDHGEHGEHKDHKDHEGNEIHHKNDYKENITEQDTSEITALLLVTNSPIANINLPRLINKQSLLQAAIPAVEMTRLTSILGLGSKSFGVLSFILITISALSIFSGLAASLENRMGDLAILRAIGYSKNRIFKIICFEGMILVTCGLIFGCLLGICIFKLFVQIINPLRISEASFVFNGEFFLIIVIVFFSGLIASISPALRASKIAVAKQLARNI